MRITVRHFARAREIAGRDEETLDLGDGARVQEAFDALCARHPALADQGAHLRFAIGATFVDANDVLDDGMTLVLIPPVGGG